MACTKHRAYIYDRGGSKRMFEIGPLESTRWNRVRDDISAANIIATHPNEKCVSFLDSLEPVRHELVIFRNGRRVWEGPITLVTLQGSAVHIEANDILFYTQRCVVKHAYDNSYPKVDYATRRIEKIIRREMEHWEEPNFDSIPPVNIFRYLDIRTTKETAKTSRKTRAYQQYVWTDLDELAARGGIDYTVHGRSLIVWDTHDSIGEGRTLTDADFANELIVSLYGRELATRSTSYSIDGKWGVSYIPGTQRGEDRFYGMVELLHSAYGEGNGGTPADPDNPGSTSPSAQELKVEAGRNLSNRYPTPIVVRVPDNSSLNPAVVDDLMDYLVPGVYFPLRSTRTARKVSQLQKLDRMSVVEDSGGETVGVTMSPAPMSKVGDEDGEVG